MSNHHTPQGGGGNKLGFKRQDVLALLITFMFGVFTGGYLYLTAFAPQFDTFTGNTEAIYEDLVVVGNQYGGFRGVPPSFQVLKDGSFRYLGFAETTETAVAKEGVVPSVIWKEVKKTLDANTLYTESRKIEATACDSYVDGVDYRYEITRESVIYSLDTCGTNFSNDSATAIALDKLWNYFETLE